MSSDRRTVLKGLAAAGLVVAGVRWAQAAGAQTAGETDDKGTLPTVTSLVSGSALDAAFLAGVKQAVNAPAGQTQSTESLQGLAVASFKRLNALLGDGEATLLVGLIDDASAALVLDLVRSAGGRVLSVQYHRLGQDTAAARWAQSLGQSLVGDTAPVALDAPTEAQGTAYVSLRCVI